MKRLNQKSGFAQTLDRNFVSRFSIIRLVFLLYILMIAYSMQEFRESGGLKFLRIIEVASFFMVSLPFQMPGSQTKIFSWMLGHWYKNPRSFGMCSIPGNLKPCNGAKNQKVQLWPWKWSNKLELKKTNFSLFHLTIKYDFLKLWQFYIFT